MARGSGIELSIVLPCRNQADHIGAVLERWFTVLSTLERPFELVAVPNACLDSTPVIVRAMCSHHPELVVVDNPRGGWGLSVRMGLAACRGAMVGYANSARTDPEIIPPLYDLALSRLPCLAKVRRENRGAPMREAGSLIYNAEGRLLFGVKSPDVNGTPKLFPRSLFDNVRLVQDGDLLDLELMAHVERMGMEVAEIPVEGFSRHGGRSTTSLASAARMYLGALSMRMGFPPRREFPADAPR